MQNQSLQDVRGYLEVTPTLLTAGQPSEQQIESMPALGFRHVINLGLQDPRYCLPDEAGLVTSLGMRYMHIPVDFNAPDSASLQQFFSELDACAAEKVLVHCAANYRVSCFVALYAQARWQWPQERASHLIDQIWAVNETWSEFLSVQRQRLGLSDGQSTGALETAA